MCAFDVLKVIVALILTGLPKFKKMGYLIFGNNLFVNPLFQVHANEFIINIHEYQAIFTLTLSKQLARADFLTNVLVPQFKWISCQVKQYIITSYYYTI